MFLCFLQHHCSTCPPTLRNLCPSCRFPAKRDATRNCPRARPPPPAHTPSEPPIGTLIDGTRSPHCACDSVLNLFARVPLCIHLSPIACIFKRHESARQTFLKRRVCSFIFSSFVSAPSHAMLFNFSNAPRCADFPPRVSAHFGRAQFVLYAFHLCAALIGAPLGDATPLVGENGAAHLSCLHTLCDISSLLSPKYYTSSPQALVPCHTGKVKTRTRALARTHTGRHRFHISVLQGSYCFTGNHVTGQTTELLMAVQCNSNRPLSFVILSLIFTAATQPNLRRPCYDPNPIMPTLQNNTDAPPPTSLLFCVFSQTAPPPRL